MKEYQVIIHGIGFEVEELVETGGDVEKNVITGFYTAKRVKAKSESNAFQKAKILVSEEDKFISLSKRSLSDDRNIKLEMEEVYVVSIWQKLFKSKPKGYIFC